MFPDCESSRVDRPHPFHKQHDSVIFAARLSHALAKVLGTLALSDTKANHIAIDGKTLKGSRRHDAKALPVLSAFATELDSRS